jgi:hypothetical protein
MPCETAAGNSPTPADSAVISHRRHSLLGALKHRFRDVHTDPLSSRK